MTDDDIRDLILERLHADPDAYRALIRDLATDLPDLSARMVEAALMQAATVMDSEIRRDGSSTDEARTARRLALLLGMDVDRASAPGDGPVTMGELLIWWQRQDDFFLRL